MSDEPRQYTREEMRAKILNHMAHLAKYWATSTIKEKEYTVLDRINGALFSTLVMFDGGSMDIPGFQMIPCPHEDDEEYAKSQEENWWPYTPEHENDIGGALHEQWHKHEQS